MDRNPPEAMLGCVSQCGKSIKSHEWLENQPSKALPTCAAGCSGHICGSHIYESQTHTLLFGFQEANNEDAYISFYFCHYLESVSTNKSQRTEMQSVQGKKSVANKVQYYLSYAHKIFSEVKKSIWQKYQIRLLFTMNHCGIHWGFSGKIF